MSHVLDSLAHSALRGLAYRIMWHSPWPAALVLAVVATVYLSRRYP